MSNSKYKLAEKMVLEISEKTGYSKEVINIVIKHFFISIRNLFRKNKEINIKGHIVFKLKSYYRKKVKNNFFIYCIFYTFTKLLVYLQYDKQVGKKKIVIIKCSVDT